MSVLLAHLFFIFENFSFHPKNNVLYYNRYIIFSEDTMPKVSFMTIAYNESGFLQALLDDLIAQDYPHDDIEVILVDGGSKDGTKGIMERFAEKRDFFACKVLDNPKRIQSAGWNIAIENASGEILIRLDAHGRIDSDFISNVVEQMDKGESIVGGQRITIFDGKRPFAKLLAHAESSPFGSGVASYRRKVSRRYVKTLAHAAYRRDVFKRSGVFNENLVRTEDNELHFRMRQSGYRFCQCPEIYSYLHARNTLKGMIKQKWGNGFWIGATLPVCPGCLSLYNFVPAAFVVVFLSAIAWCVQNNSLFALAFLGFFYMLAAIIATIREIIKEPSWAIKPLLLLLPPIFLLLHFFYGAGTIFGMVFSPILVVKNKNKG